MRFFFSLIKKKKIRKEKTGRSEEFQAIKRGEGSRKSEETELRKY